MEKIFNDILEKDEKILKVIKPNKKIFWKSAFFFCLIPLCWPPLIIMLIGSLFTLPFLHMKSYKNLFYAYTNKRLIKRSGIVGVNYESLEYQNITSTSVNVSFLEKGCNTGTLKFASPSTQEQPMVFDYVENPYEIMKEIKEQISKVESK